MKNLVTVHFDGPIARDHTLDLRTFSKTLSHLQSAIDRAHLDIKYGKIWKNATMKDSDYEPTKFFVKQTREGGFIADLLGNDDSEKMLKRVHDAVAPPHEESIDFVEIEKVKLTDLAADRRKNYMSGAQVPAPYENFWKGLDQAQNKAYGDRSIAKEFDEIASTIRARKGDGSFVEIDIYAGKPLSKITFDATTAVNFHKLVSARSLGDPIELLITLRSLDSGNGGISKAKALNLVSEKQFNLHILTDRGFGSLRKYLKKRNPEPFKIVACPVLEYGAFDPMAGDMYLVAVLDE